MNTGEANEKALFAGDPNPPVCFGEWLKRRRQGLDLTQEQLAMRASCSVFAIRKIEAGDRRPSRQLAALLAQALEIAPENQAGFIKVARGELSLERLSSLARASAGKAQPPVKPVADPGHLPRALTPFIGREPELSALGQLLRDPQCLLLTIVGPGGIGKTRLAIEAASQFSSLFSDGVWFVPLEALNAPALLLTAIVNALDLRFQGPANPQAQLLRYLCEKRALLILDNAEHLLDGLGLFSELLDGCPQLKLLVTSRERLNLLSEWVFEISGLPAPSSDRMEQFEAYSSVALFMQSARRAVPDFMPDELDRAGIAGICRLVEGMPLAIELAASWVRTLSMAEIAAEIEHSLDFLSTTTRDVPARHHSMRAVFDQSYQMLSTEEQQVLCQLSVFKGGFQRQAAEQVAGASLSILSKLMDQTLVRRSQVRSHRAVMRFDQHELIRQYSAARLLADPQAYAATRKRHYAFFLALAETAVQELKGPGQLDWLNRLEQDLDNLRAAMDWALNIDPASQGIDEPALKLVGALAWFWRMRGHFHEGQSWLKQALHQNGQSATAARARALLGTSLMIIGLGDIAEALPLEEESVAIYRALGDLPGLAEALTITGTTLIWQGEAALGRDRLEEALALAREAGDRWGEALALYRLGSFLSDYFGNPAGQVMLAESAAILEELGEKYLFASVLASLGIVETGLGDYTAARDHFERSLAVAQEIGHPWGIADARTNLGCLFRILGDYAAAHSQLEEAHRVYREHSSTWEIDAICALVENYVAQGDLSAAQLHLQSAVKRVGLSENRWLQVLVNYLRGLLAYYLGDAGESAMQLEGAVKLAREGQYKPDLARALVALGRVRCQLDELEQASGTILEGLRLFRALGHQLGIAAALEALAAVRAAQQESLQATMFYGAAHTLREKLGAPLAPIDSAARDSTIAASRALLGETAFQAAWAGAAARPLQEVMAGILADFPTFSPETETHPR